MSQKRIAARRLWGREVVSDNFYSSNLGLGIGYRAGLAPYAQANLTGRIAQLVAQRQRNLGARGILTPCCAPRSWPSR